MICDRCGGNGWERLWGPVFVCTRCGIRVDYDAVKGRRMRAGYPCRNDPRAVRLRPRRR